MQKIIVTADDYGLCDEVNEAIEHLINVGVLSSTNVLTNFTSDFSTSQLKNKKNISIGLHWNVTTGKPVSNPQHIKTLVDENGDFWPINVFRKKYHRGLIDKDELRLELENQYEIFYKNFGRPSYWNSHENSALYPQEFKVFEAVARDKRISATRNFQRVYIDYQNCKGIKRKTRELLVKVFVDFWFGIRTKRYFNMPKGRIVTFVNATKTNPKMLKRALDKTKKKSVEIIIHPALSGDNELFGNIGKDRVEEFSAYMSREFYNILCNEKRRIICFEEL